LPYLRLRRRQHAGGKASFACIIPEHAMKLRGLASVGLLTEKIVVSATFEAKTRVQPIMPNTGSFTYWYLQVPNLILLAMMALLLVRLVLSLLLSSSSGVMRPVGAITYPVVATVGAVTPRIMPAAGVVVCAIIWLAAIRTGLVMVALAMGVRL
jgi:hypothetical protein